MKTFVWLDNSRILSIVAVVFLHVSAGVVGGNEIGSTYWWIGNVYDSLVRWCVPVFVMISGALLLDPDKSETLSSFYKKRLARILVPIIFWSVFYLCFIVLRNLMSGDAPSITNLVQRVLYGTPYYHMWFLYMILILYLFTPFFRKIIVSATRKEIVVFVIISFLIAIINTAYIGIVSGASSTDLFIIRFLPYVPFFFTGYLIQSSDRQPSKILLWIIFVASIVFTIFGLYYLGIRRGYSIGLYFYDYLSITIVPMSISFMFLLKTWVKPIINLKFTGKLSSLTLGIYLIHIIFMEAINKAGFGANSFYPAISIPAVTLVVIVISIIGAWLISKIPYLKKTL